METCDHIVGFALSDFPEHGGTDCLVKQSESIQVTTQFHFCPNCGVRILSNNQDMSILNPFATGREFQNYLNKSR